jgi:hypothetical protein
MIGEILTLMITVLSILTGVFTEIRTTLLHEMRSVDLSIFSSLKRLEICCEMEQKAEREIAKKHLETSEDYRLNAIYMNFVALYTLSAVISSSASFLFLNIPFFSIIFLFFFCLAFLFCAFAVLIFLGGRYRYFKVGLLEKLSWRFAELVIPNFVGGAIRDKDVTHLINEDAEIRQYQESLENNKRIKKLLSYSSKRLIFP